MNNCDFCGLFSHAVDLIHTLDRIWMHIPWFNYKSPTLQKPHLLWNGDVKQDVCPTPLFKHQSIRTQGWSSNGNNEVRCSIKWFPTNWIHSCLQSMGDPDTSLCKRRSLSEDVQMLKLMWGWIFLPATRMSSTAKHQQAPDEVIVWLLRFRPQVS